MKFRFPKFKKISDTPYYQALQKYSQLPFESENYGLKHSHGNVDGVFLTIDMCPSAKPFEKFFFEDLKKLANPQNKPLPIAIAMSSAWMLQHDQEFKWLATQREFDITWINHSFSHLYYSDIKMEDNFLNLPRTNITQEILYPEQMLLTKGLTPSVFFRFPGLVASAHLLKVINELGLIPVGTDAWLAKDENPTAGSIILLHGNSNEHLGIEMFTRWKKNNKFSFLPLQQAITSLKN